ncbi:ferrous iron transporter A (plasmid) [Borrelia coriaceae]|nr:hypothetical protein [Borrelia coriaceae]UPA15882.1 ferrous iron transporter A [Borrelia coriaceae]UPA17244.1 ferrous iron transporter A [Borrelia coriaceae]
MKSKNKYIALGLLLNFISCDLILNDEMKEKSLGLLGKIQQSVLDGSEKSVEKSTKKKKKVVKKKRKPSAVVNQSIVNSDVAQNLVSGGMIDVLKEQYSVQKDITFANGLNKNDEVVLKEESPQVVLSSIKTELSKEKIQEPQNIEITNENSITGVETYDSVKSTSHNSSASVEPKKEVIVQNNAFDIDFTIDSDLSQTISGSNSFSYVEEIEEDEDDYYFQEGEVIEDEEDEYELEDKKLFEEETRLSNRYNAYLSGVRHNVNTAIRTIDKIYNNFELFATQKFKMHSTRFDSVVKAQAKERAKEFTKEKLDQDLSTLLNCIQAGAKTAANLVRVYEKKAKTLLDGLETEARTLVANIKKETDSYEGYKAILKSTILEMKKSLNIVKFYIGK